MSEPKLFISYSWSTPEHQKWVLRLGTELRENGVDVLLDKWDLKEGHDANAFMEKMVSDESIKKVIIVLDEQYSDKANKRSGGVGTETQIISAEVYESVDQNKFVAVIASRDQEGKAKLPVFYKSRIYIDLSDDGLYGSNFEQLLRWIYDKPLNIKPELGKKPVFLNEEASVSLGTSVIFRRLIDALKSSRPHANGALVEYFSLFSRNLSRFRLEPSRGGTEFDQKVLDSINQLLPARNELIEVFSTIAQYDLSTGAGPIIHKFFESLIPYLDKPENVTSYHKWDWDNLKFVIQESFMICIGVLLKHERYDLAECLVRQRYFAESDNYGQSKMHSYGIFRNHLESLSYRNNRLKLRRLSVHADLLKERCTDSGLSFNNLMQADFLLYLAESLQGLAENRRQEWWPESLVFKSFHGGTFEMFLRAESLSYFNRMANLLGISSKSDFTALVEGLKSQAVYVPKWGFDNINPLELMNYDRLCIRP
ncbi:TIR domain-containing protein [Pseudomonas sp. B21-040]|uniref:toll/interleukin-1 receptor domain-containing protein n=1 Tax=Pseudomonas sp. B21-040 TaxID=2895486 RepID=UPI00215FED75|nr:TIR domain-containing protein [Pseudomonas sp. B21-040]UVL43101.1 TIR domain-containing protein [Pseudomonas sp. B21-040]